MAETFLPHHPGITPRSLAELAERQVREAAALRENLRRRKQQQRSRDAKLAPASDGPASTGPQFPLE